MIPIRIRFLHEITKEYDLAEYMDTHGRSLAIARRDVHGAINIYRLGLTEIPDDLEPWKLHQAINYVYNRLAVQQEAQ